MKLFKQKARKILSKIVTAIFLFPFPKLRRDVKRVIMHGGLILDTLWKYRHGEPEHFKYELSLLLCARNEGKNIAEWIEYHLLHGVEHFYIYDNDSEDNTRQVLLPYIERGLVTMISFHGRGQQVAMYRDAIMKFRDETRWMGITDCDEFFFLRDGRRLIDFIRGYEDFSQILVHWVLYGSSGRRERGEGLVIERFRMHATGPTALTKAILNPRRVLEIGVHSSHVLGNSCNETKKAVCHIRDYNEETPVANLIRLNHYCIKSWEEFLEKRSRGDVALQQNCPSQKCSEAFFQSMDINDVVDSPSLMDPYAKQIRMALGMSVADSQDGADAEPKYENAAAV